MMIDEKPSYKVKQLWSAMSELTFSEMREAARIIAEAVGDMAGTATEVTDITAADWMESLDLAQERFAVELAEYEAKGAAESAS